MAKKWGDVQSEIKRLYLTENRPLYEVRTLMKKNHDFYRSARAYKTQMKKWQYQKYKHSRHHDMRASSSRTFPIKPRKHRTIVSSTTALNLNEAPSISNASLSEMEQELQYQAKMAKEQGVTLLSARQSSFVIRHATQAEEIDESIAKIARIEERIASMRKSLDTMRAMQSTESPQPAWKDINLSPSPLGLSAESRWARNGQGGLDFLPSGESIDLSGQELIPTIDIDNVNDEDEDEDVGLELESMELALDEELRAVIAQTEVEEVAALDEWEQDYVEAGGTNFLSPDENWR